MTATVTGSARKLAYIWFVDGVSATTLDLRATAADPRRIDATPPDAP